MNEDALKEGFAELDLLAKAEYRQSLEEVLQDSDSQRGAARVGRLVGVLIKQPFAKSQALPQPSAGTAAYRGWDLLKRAILTVDSPPRFGNVKSSK